MQYPRHPILWPVVIYPRWLPIHATSCRSEFFPAMGDRIHAVSARRPGLAVLRHHEDLAARWCHRNRNQNQRRLLPACSAGNQHGGQSLPPWRSGLAQEGCTEIHADKTVAFTNGVQLFVCQIAGLRAECVGVGVAGDQWGIADACGLPEPFFIHVRQIHHDAFGVTGFHQAQAGFRQSGTDIGRRRETKRYAVAEYIRSTPEWAQGAANNPPASPPCRIRGRSI